MRLPPIVLLFALLVPVVSAVAAEPWDAEPFSADPKAVLAAANEGPKPSTAIEVLLDETAYTIDADGRRGMKWHYVYRVLDAKAADKSHETAFAVWHPWYQDRPELKARVVGPDGRVSELDPKTIAESPLSQLDHDLYSDSKALVAPLPAFVDGAVVEIFEQRRERNAPFRTGFGTVLDLQEFVPVRKARVSLRMPKSLPFRHTLDRIDALVRIREDGAERVVTLEVGPLPALDPPEGDLPRGDPARAQFGFTLGTTWQAAAREYAEIVAQAVARDDLAAEARRVVGDAKTPEAAVDRILGWMKDLRYSGVEFGNAAFVPRSPRETLVRGFGDCKDLATLMVAMLRASGYRASVALLHVRGLDVSEQLPTLSGFDHAIVRVDGVKPLWVDPTSPLHHAGTLPWSDQGRRALVADAKTTVLERIPVLPSSQNQLRVLVEVQLADSGSGNVKDTREASAGFAAFFRQIRRSDLKTRRESIERWMKSTYNVEAISSFEESGCTPGEPCRMIVAGTESKRALTGEVDAIAIVNPFAPFADVAEVLRSDDEQPGARIRKQPLEMPAGIVEVRYRVVPPPGFRARSLPAPLTQPLGPGSYSSGATLLPDGSVEAVFRVDTAKPIYSAAEVTAFRKATNGLRLDAQSRIAFDSEVALLMKDGKTKEALDRARALAAAQPGVGAHQARLSRALLEAGFGDLAREAARRGTELAPKDSAAWRGLGFALEHDGLGRRFHPPFDRDAAIASFQKAKALKVEATTLAELATILERDGRGERWTTGARLEEAAAEYRALAELQRTHDPDQFALADVYYLGRHEEVLTRASEAPQTLLRNQIWVASLAARRGVPAALAKAEQLTTSDENRRALLLQSVPHLLRLRLYPEATALFQAGQGPNADAQNRGALALMPRLKTRNQWGIPPNDPRLIAVRLFELSLETAPDPEQLKRLLSTEASAGTKPKDPEGAAAAITAVAFPLRSLLLPRDVMLDFVMAAFDWTVSGDSRMGWRLRGVPLTGGEKRTTLFVVKEGDASRILAIAPAFGPIGLRALHLATEGQRQEARQWLAWAREAVAELPNAGGEGWASYLELSTPAAIESDAGLTTAATVLALHGPGPVAVEPVLEARKRAGADRLGASLDWALAAHFVAREQWERVLEPAERLMAAERTSSLPFFLRTNALVKVGRSAEAESLARARLADIPGDEVAQQMLISALHARGDVQGAWKLAKERLASGRATASDYNGYAWDALVLGIPDSDAYQAAQRASQMTNGKNANILNTYAALSAATGRPGEARKLLLETLQALGDRPLRAADWLVVGLMAEQYGLVEAARSAFGKAASTETTEEPATASATIAKARMAKLAAAPPR